MNNELQITMLGYATHQYSTSPAIDHSFVQKRQLEKKIQLPYTGAYAYSGSEFTFKVTLNLFPS